MKTLSIIIIIRAKFAFTKNKKYIGVRDFLHIFVNGLSYQCQSFCMPQIIIMPNSDRSVNYSYQTRQHQISINY